MADLIVYIQNHQYDDDDVVYVSWLDANRYVADASNDSFKLALAMGGSEYEEFASTITDGFVKETVDTAASTTITGLDHLIGESVQLTKNGLKIGTFIVDENGEITVPTAIYDNYNVGLPYTSTLQPMKQDISGLGLSMTKKPSRVVVSLNQTVGGEIGPNTQNMDKIVYKMAGDTSEEFPFFTGDREVKLPGGYNRSGDIMVRQTEPLPMTVVGLAIDIGVNND